MNDPKALDYLREKDIAGLIDGAVSSLLRAVVRQEAPEDPQAYIVDWLTNNRPAKWKCEEEPAKGSVTMYGLPLGMTCQPIAALAAKHMGDSFTLKECNLFTADHTSVQFGHMNPWRQIPTLKTGDGMTIIDSNAALIYLASKYGPAMLPKEKRARVYEALERRQTSLYPAFKPIGYYVLGFFMPRPGPEVAQPLYHILTKMEGYLQDGKFVGGDIVTIADLQICSLIVTLDHPLTKALGFELPARWVQWHADMKQELGAVYEKAYGPQLQYLQTREGKLGEPIAFPKYEAPAAGPGDWQAEAAPEGGVVVHGVAMSPTSAPLVLFCEKHIAEGKYKLQPVDFFKGEHKSEGFLKIHPFGQVPAATIDGVGSMGEGHAIMRVLAETHAPAVYGADAEKRCRVDQVLDKKHGQLMPAWVKIGFYGFALPGVAKPTHKDFKALDKEFGLMADAFLSGRKFLAGDTLTLADYSVVIIVAYLTFKVYEKIGYSLPKRWVQYLADVRAEYGAEKFDKAMVPAQTFLDGNVDKVERCGLPRVWYFDAKGRAECIRILLAAAGVQFENKFITADDAESKAQLPFGTVPAYEDADVFLTQSNACISYIAAKNGLDGDTTVQKAQVMQYVLEVDDLKSAYVSAAFAPDEVKEKLNERLVKGYNEKWVPGFEKALGDGDFLVGGKLTAADVCLYDVLSQFASRKTPGIELQGKLKAYCDKIAAIPRIAEYLKSRS